MMFFSRHELERASLHTYHIQVAGAGSELLAHPSNSDHDTNPDGWLLEDARAGRVHGSSHRLASEHPQCAHQHLTGAQLATLFPPMGVLKNRSFPLHSFACFSHIQGNQIPITLLAFAQAVYEARFQTSRTLPQLLRGSSARRSRQSPMARQTGPPVPRQAVPLWRIRYRARVGRRPPPRHAIPGALHPRWLRSALDRQGRYPAQGAPLHPSKTKNHGEMEAV